MLQIGENIRLIRSLTGKTQVEFAEIIGEKLSNLKTYETKDVMPKPHIQHIIAKIAGVSKDDLLNKSLIPDNIRINLMVDKVENVNRETWAMEPNTPYNLIVGTELIESQADAKDYLKKTQTKNKDTMPVEADLSKLVGRLIERLIRCEAINEILLIRAAESNARSKGISVSSSFSKLKKEINEVADRLYDEFGKKG